MKVPSVLWVAIILVLPPMLIPVIEQFFPSNTYWWSALLVVLLNALVLIVKMSWPAETAKATTPQPDGALGAPISAAKIKQEEDRGLIEKLFIFGA